MAKPRTLFDKIWDAIWSTSRMTAPACIYIDRHLVHEVTSPQAFEGLRTGRPHGAPSGSDAGGGRPQRADHRPPPAASPNEESRIQVETLARQRRAISASPICRMDDMRQGIVHIIGPEQGFTLPGTTIVCGDSHTSTHGAFGALAFGIGTSEVEHVLATQTLVQKPAKNMRVDGRRARCPPASPPRTSCWRSSARSAPPAAPAMSSNTPARPSARCRWKAA